MSSENPFNTLPDIEIVQLTVIKSISVGLAFIRLLQFYSRCKDVLKPHAVVAKLAAVKGIIGVTFLQTVSALPLLQGR